MKQKTNNINVSKSDTKKKIQWLLILRLIILFFLVIATISIQKKKDIVEYYLNFIYYFISVSFLFTLVSLFWQKKTRNYILFCYVQLVWDIIFVTAIIYLTGGSRSIFSFLYILSIINASIILFRIGAFIIALLSSTLYTVLLLLENYSVIKYTTTLAPDFITLFPVRSSDLIFKIFINLAAFFIVAYLSSYLSEQLRRTGEELKEFQVDYEELEAINRNIVQSINSGLITINNDDRITFLNHSAEDLTGYSLAKAYNININEIFNDIDLNTSRNRLEKGINRFEFKYLRDDDSELYLGLSFSNLRDTKGNDLGKILIFQDLTNIKEMEERLKVTDKLAAIGKMAAGIAHEIRNPMASISASIQMLKQEVNLDENNQKLMDIILRESDRLNLLITDLLLFAKPTKSEKEIVKISLIMNETIELLKRSPAFNTNISITKDIDDDLTIKADSNQLRQIFFNLIINSLEAMNSDGELALTIKKSDNKSDDGPEYAEIIVKDNGTGIEESILDRIYDPFFTTKEQGTGLGLAIVYRIIENHNGQIYLNTDAGKGSEFHILLPVV